MQILNIKLSIFVQIFYQKNCSKKISKLKSLYISMVYSLIKRY